MYNGGGDCNSSEYEKQSPSDILGALRGFALVEVLAPSRNGAGISPRLGREVSTWRSSSLVISICGLQAMSCQAATPVLAGDSRTRNGDEILTR